MKKISIFLIAVLMLLLIATPAFAVTAADNGKLKVYTTSGGLEASWLKGFDIKGHVQKAGSNADTLISSTYSDDGYHVFLNVNGANGVMAGELSTTDLQQKLENMHYKQVDGTQVINGIQLGVTTSFINGGKHIKIVYNLKNTTATAAKISLATAADVEIDGDDHATITRLDNGNGVLLYTDDGSCSDKPVQFAFYGKGVSGTTAIDSLWIGSWGNSYFTNMFNNNPTVSKVENRDSAFAFAWLNRDIAAGATQTYSVLMEVGDVNIPTLELTTPNNSKLYYDEAIIEGIVRDGDLIDTATIHYKVDNGTEQTLPAIAMNGTAKNFSIDLTSLNLTVGSTHTIKVWATDRLNTKSNEEEISFTIKEVRPPVLNVASTNWLKADAKFNITDTVNSAARVQKYEYKLDNGAWQTATLATDYVARTTTGTTTISARAVGISGEVSDVVTKVIKLDTTAPTVTIGANAENATITAVDTNSGVGSIQYLWSNSNTAPAASATWSNYTDPVSYTGNLTGTIYLWAKATDVAGNVTISFKEFIRTPVINAPAGWQTTDVKFNLTDTLNTPATIAKYEYKLDDGAWQTATLGTEYIALTASGTTTIYARAVGVSGETSGIVSKVVKLDKTVPTVTFNTNAGAISILGADVNSGVASTKYLWSESNQTPAANATWSNYTGDVSYTGNLTDTIYLFTEVTDAVGNVTVSSKAINAVKAPKIVAENEFKDKYAEFKIEDAENAAADVATYQYKVNNGQWVNLTKDTAKQLDGITGKITISARTVDHAGRVSAEVSKEVTVTITGPVKDNTPKTGNVDFIGAFLTIIVIISLVGIAKIVKK